MDFLKHLLGNNEALMKANNPADIAIQNKAALKEITPWLFTGSHDRQQYFSWQKGVRQKLGNLGFHFSAKHFSADLFFERVATIGMPIVTAKDTLLWVRSAPLLRHRFQQPNVLELNLHRWSDMNLKS